VLRPGIMESTLRVRLARARIDDSIPRQHSEPADVADAVCPDRCSRSRASRYRSRSRTFRGSVRWTILTAADAPRERGLVTAKRYGVRTRRPSVEFLVVEDDRDRNPAFRRELWRRVHVGNDVVLLESEHVPVGSRSRSGSVDDERDSELGRRIANAQHTKSVGAGRDNALSTGRPSLITARGGGGMPPYGSVSRFSGLRASPRRR